MKNIFRGRKIKYGSVSLALTVLVVAAVIIINAAFSALAYSYGWGVNMSSEFAYGISEKCEAYLENTIFPLMDKANKASGEKNKIKIIFCDELENLDDELSQEYVLNSILSSRKNTRTGSQPSISTYGKIRSSQKLTALLRTVTSCLFLGINIPHFQ